MDIVLPLLFIRFFLNPQQKWISKNHRRKVERVDKSEISPNGHVFVSTVSREIEENVTFKTPETLSLTIFCVLSTEFQIYTFT